MEQLDLLEQHISDLLKELTSLRAEKKRLTEQLAQAAQVAEEIPVLKQELAGERQVKEQAKTRVDALLKRIQQSLESDRDANPEQNPVQNRGPAHNQVQNQPRNLLG